MATNVSTEVVEWDGVIAQLNRARSAYARSLAEHRKNREREPQKSLRLFEQVVREYQVDRNLPVWPEARLSETYSECRDKVLSVKLGDMPSSALVKMAEITALASVLGDLTETQLRRFYGSVQRLATRLRHTDPAKFDKSEVELLKVPLAYAAGRHPRAKEFCHTCVAALDAVRSGGREGYLDWERFRQFVEGVIAYHKYYGGKESEGRG